MPTLLVAGIMLPLATPGGRALAQESLYFFTRAESDWLSVSAWQLTPVPETTTPEQRSIIDSADYTVSEVEEALGFDVLEPTWLPAVLSFEGANFDAENNIALLFYRYRDTYGMVLSEEPFAAVDDCELCDLFGASAAIETVPVGDVSGEYVEGTWIVHDSEAVWKSNPYFKRLRWRANGMAFQIFYMGPPDSVTQADMIAVAESLH